MGKIYDAKMTMLYAEGDCKDPFTVAVELIQYFTDQETMTSDCMILSWAVTDAMGKVTLRNMILSPPDGVPYAKKAYQELAGAVAQEARENNETDT